MPSRSCPRLELPTEWVYVIDLDQNVLRVCMRDDPSDWTSYETQFFGLDSIPKWIFERNEVGNNSNQQKIYNVSSIMEMFQFQNVPTWYQAPDLLKVPASKPELLEYHQSFLPQPVYSVPPAAHIPACRRLQLQLLQQLIEYFLRSMEDVCPSRKRSTFVFRQLAYAILCLTRGSTGMKFRQTNTAHKLFFGNINDGIRTPTWEPPSTNSYWLGDVLIVLDEYIYCKSVRPAAIAKVVQLACAKHPASDVMAVIFSIHRIIIVRIHQTPLGPEVSHSNALSLLGNVTTAFTTKKMAILRGIMYTTPGIVALLDLFASRPPQHPPSAIVSRPYNLPTEICEQIFRGADSATQCALELSCRLFRDIAIQNPRIGRWTFLKCSGDRNFAAVHGLSETRYVVKVEPMPYIGIEPQNSGFEVGFWGNGVRVQLNMPLLVVTEVIAKSAERG